MSYVTRNPQLCSGSPTVTGTRLTVYDVIEGIAGDGYEFYLETFSIEAATAEECLLYCANLRCNDIRGIDLSYCYGCVLNKEFASSLENMEEITLPSGDKIIKNGSEIFLGDFADYLQSREKIEGWKVAESIIAGRNAGV